MNLLAELKSRFAPALADLVDDPAPLLEMIRPSGNPQFGDYQANFAMPLGKQLNKPPRDIAADIVAEVDVGDLCQPPEVAGPGFINLKIKDEVLAGLLQQAVGDERLGVPATADPKTYVVDFSSPNVAKPMHVGHIRSTVIGDSICRTLRFLGHNVISDNHLGDWGTQFGMIIYGWRHFGDQAAYDAAPVEELTRVYRLVRRLMDHFESQRKLPQLQEKLTALEAGLAEKEAAPATGDKKADKKASKELEKIRRDQKALKSSAEALAEKLDSNKTDDEFSELLEQHGEIESAVLAETAKLHDGDEENLALWKKFLPTSREHLQPVYDRLDVKFDHELGESFYHERLAQVVNEFEAAGLARESQGAMCVFLDGFDTPMIIRKQDGAYLYATTDLATIEYRLETWKPDAILYVVDHRQSEHFQKLFHAARLWKESSVDFRHIGFGTVTGPDGKPIKTKEGDLIGLEWLLDEAVAAADKTIQEIESRKPEGPQYSPEQRRAIAWTIGHAAIKYFDLSQNRESDYKFDLKKMAALEGDTAVYMEYAYARANGIFAKGEVDVATLRTSGAVIELGEDAERGLALRLARFAETLEEVISDFRPNLLTAYLYDLAKAYSVFFEQCHVLKAESDDIRSSRLLLCDLTARTLKQGLDLLGIDVVERM